MCAFPLDLVFTCTRPDCPEGFAGALGNGVDLRGINDKKKIDVKRCEGAAKALRKWPSGPAEPFRENGCTPLPWFCVLWLWSPYMPKLLTASSHDPRRSAQFCYRPAPGIDGTYQSNQERIRLGSGGSPKRSMERCSPGIQDSPRRPWL